MSENGTPRTDSALMIASSLSRSVLRLEHLAKFCRHLEIELQQARAEIAAIRAAELPEEPAHDADCRMYHGGCPCSCGYHERVADAGKELRAYALRVTAERDLEHKRYAWCANELLACDYGDNNNPEDVVGWRVYGWRDRTGERRIYGASINEAVDAELSRKDTPT